MRPIKTRFSGGFCSLRRFLPAELLDETRRGLGEDRPFRLPVSQAVLGDAQPFLAFRSLGIVEADALDEAPVACAARVGHHHMVKRAFLGAGACETYDYHVILSASCLMKMREGRDFTPDFCPEARQMARGRTISTAIGAHLTTRHQLDDSHR